MLEIRNKRHFILSRNSTVIWISHVSCSFAAVAAFINTVLYFREIDAKYSKIPQLARNSRVVELNKQKKKSSNQKNLEVNSQDFLFHLHWPFWRFLCSVLLADYLGIHWAVSLKAILSAGHWHENAAVWVRPLWSSESFVKTD